jgi:hypothetical protein
VKLSVLTIALIAGLWSSISGACPAGYQEIGEEHVCVPAPSTVLDRGIQNLETSFPDDVLTSRYYRCVIEAVSEMPPGPNPEQVKRLNLLIEKLDQTFPLPDGLGVQFFYNQAGKPVCHIVRTREA